MNEQLILVDDQDNQVGVMDKLSVHQQGLLHRAFSIFIFNSQNQLLLQQRAANKYHSSLLWSNTCCSHPLNNEIITDTIKRRLQEEMGLVCDTKFAFTFIYKSPFANGLTEFELDHVYIGRSDELPKPNSEEVRDWKYISLENLEKEISLNPGNFSEWLRICLPRVANYLNNNF